MFTFPRLHKYVEGKRRAANATTKLLTHLSICGGGGGCVDQNTNYQQSVTTCTILIPVYWYFARANSHNVSSWVDLKLNWTTNGTQPFGSRYSLLLLIFLRHHLVAPMKMYFKLKLGCNNAQNVTHKDNIFRILIFVSPYCQFWHHSLSMMVKQLTTLNYWKKWRVGYKETAIS